MTESERAAYRAGQAAMRRRSEVAIRREAIAMIEGAVPDLRLATSLDEIAGFVGALPLEDPPHDR